MSARIRPHEVRDYKSAARYLAAGRSKIDRPLPGKATRLVHLDDERIAVRLYSTNVVVYHRRGVTDLFHDGWATLTTMDRINTYAPARVAGLVPMRLLVDDPKRTPARITKCRTCSGMGLAKLDYPWRPGEHPSGSLRYPPGTCYRCGGTGRADYGSKPLYPAFTAGDALRVSSRKGRFLGRVEPAPGHLSQYKPAYVPKPKPAPLSVGHNVPFVLHTALPVLMEGSKCPSCGALASISNTVVHLNDSHRWSREAVADWLDTLDADLSFPVPTTITGD